MKIKKNEQDNIYWNNNKNDDDYTYAVFWPAGKHVLGLTISSELDYYEENKEKLKYP